jgi:hypothetical protein
MGILKGGEGLSFEMPGREGPKGFGREGPKGFGKEGPKGFGKEGPKGFGREGPKGFGRGGPNSGTQAQEVAVEALRQVTSLPGFLMVAFVAPMAPTASNGDYRAASVEDLAFSTLAGKASAHIQAAANAQATSAATYQAGFLMGTKKRARPRKAKTAPVRQVKAKDLAGYSGAQMSTAHDKVRAGKVNGKVAPRRPRKPKR